MASTPPLQVRSTVRTPPTPLHGPAYDVEPQSRYLTRSSQRRTSQELRSTPEQDRTPRKSQANTSGNRSRRSSRSSTPSTSQIQSQRNLSKGKPSRRVQVVSPSSPGIESPAPTPITTSKPQPTFLSSNTIMADGMLPTPVKTPRKRKVPGVSITARALFQEQQPVLGEEVSSQSRRGRKGRRFNGFSLESFSAEDEGISGHVQVFVDSRDNVPNLDASDDNPFMTHPPNNRDTSAKRSLGNSKRRKVSGERQVDSEVQQTFQSEEGLVYVFRGKKLFKKFGDEGEEEEEIDAEDLGLLQDRGADTLDIKPLRPLTRRSVKPTRLFQTEEQKRAREAEKEEEAITDIEDNARAEVNNLKSPSTPTKPGLVEVPVSPPSTRRALRSTARKGQDEINFNESAPPMANHQAKKRTKISPFDNWKRLKAGTTARETKTRKRASEAVEYEETGAIKKSKSG